MKLPVGKIDLHIHNANTKNERMEHNNLLFKCVLNEVGVYVDTLKCLC